MKKQALNGRGWIRLVNASRCSLQGLSHIWRHEEAFRLECVLLVPGLVLALVFGGTGCERALLAGSLLLILLVEILNTAVECAIDRIGPEEHPLSGAAKDLGSTAVFLAIVMAVIIWILVLLG